MKETKPGRLETDIQGVNVIKVKRMEQYTLRSVTMTANLNRMLSHRDR